MWPYEFLIRDELPNYPHSELNLSRGSCCHINCPSARDGIAIRIEQISVVDRCLEVGVIEDIKELKPKLNVETLGDLLDIVVFEQREIEIGQTWPDHTIARDISEQVTASARRRREWRALCLKRSGGTGGKRRKSETV